MGALNQRLKFGPRDIRVDFIAGAGGCEATIIAGDDSLAADDSGEAGNTLRDQVWVLDQGDAM